MVLGLDKIYLLDLRRYRMEVVLNRRGGRAAQGRRWV